MGRDASTGRFTPGAHPDLHRFTKQEQQFGYFVTMHCRKLPFRLKASVRKKITGYYQERNRSRTAQQKG